nr:olfactory receptor 6N1-like [Chelonoidis abingdonii]
MHLTRGVIVRVRRQKCSILTLPLPVPPQAAHDVLRRKISNQITVTEFLLQSFSDAQELQILHFVVFLGIFLAAQMLNLLIIAAVALDHHLHTYMYFFLMNLSMIDLGYISVTVPNLISCSWTQTIADRDWGNQTAIKEFILLGFGDLPDLQILLFLMFLVIYMATVAGNTLIVVLIMTDQHLHTPMYFFLGNLSCLETCYMSTILPRLLASLLTGKKTILVSDCITQLYFCGSLGCTECYLLAAMSYDRYLAICKPLHYSALMNIRFCLQLAAGSCFNGCLAVIIFVSFLSQLLFCGPNEIDHFYCDAIPLMELSCSDTHLVILVDFIIACVFTLPPFLLTLTSYMCIISTILRIPSTTGRQKAFSTCSSHLIVVTIFYGSIMIVYLLPKHDTLKDLKKVLSLCYTVLTPLVNPLIYSLRNREVKEAFCKAVSKCGFHQNAQIHLHNNVT